MTRSTLEEGVPVSSSAISMISEGAFVLLLDFHAPPPKNPFLLLQRVYAALYIYMTPFGNEKEDPSLKFLVSLLLMRSYLSRAPADIGESEADADSLEEYCMRFPDDRKATLDATTSLRPLVVSC